MTDLQTVLATLTPETRKVYDALVANTEGGQWVRNDGSVTNTVYLFNAQCDLDMSAHQFAGHLSALKKADLYWPEDIDGVFGDVRIS